jgi:hypothetical protein
MRSLTVYDLDVDCQASLVYGTARFDCPNDPNVTNDNWRRNIEIKEDRIRQFNHVTLLSNAPGFETVEVKVVGRVNGWVEENVPSLEFDVTTT